MALSTMPSSKIWPYVSICCIDFLPEKSDTRYSTVSRH